MSEFDIALRFNLFDGDFGDGETTVLNEIQTASPPSCHVCAATIKPGTLIRKLVETTLDPDDGFSFADYERSRREYFVCDTCCNAARSDFHRKLPKRYAIGEKRRSRQNG